MPRNLPLSAATVISSVGEAGVEKSPSIAATPLAGNSIRLRPSSLFPLKCVISAGCGRVTPDGAPCLAAPAAATVLCHFELAEKSPAGCRYHHPERSKATKPPPRGRGFGGGVTCWGSASCRFSMPPQAGSKKRTERSDAGGAGGSAPRPLGVRGWTRPPMAAACPAPKHW